MIPFARGKAVGAAIGALALVGGAFVAGETVYPERSRPVVEKASPMPVAAPVAPPAAPAGPATEEEEAPAEEAAKEDPVEATEPLADWTVASGGRLGFTARWNGEAVGGSRSEEHTSELQSIMRSAFA